MKKTLISLLTLMLLLYAVFGLAACGQKIDVESVSFEKKFVSLASKGSEALAYTVLPEKASNKKADVEVADNTVVKYENGTIKAVSSGTTTITVTTADGNKTDVCTVTVALPEGYSLHENAYMKLIYPTSYFKDSSAAGILFQKSATETLPNFSFTIEDKNLAYNILTASQYKAELETMYSQMGLSATVSTPVITTPKVNNQDCVKVTVESVVAGMSFYQEMYIIHTSAKTCSLTFTGNSQSQITELVAIILSEYYIK